MPTTPLPTCPETPFTGPDGIIWPVERAAMQDRALIIKRMSQDCYELLTGKGEAREDGWITSADLHHYGWSLDQISRHCGEALTKATQRLNRRKNRGY